MKKQLFTFVAAMGLALLLNAGTLAQEAVTIRAEIPFEFSINNKTLPAGTYRIGPASTDTRALWTIGDTSDGPGQFLLAGIVSSRNFESGDLKLMFHRYGEKNFLVGFETQSYEIGLPTSKAEKSVRLMAGKVAEKVMMPAGTVDAMSH